MHGARAVVAIFNFRTITTSLTTVLGLDKRASENVSTCTTRYTASWKVNPHTCSRSINFEVSAPFTFNAVYRTREDVASLEISGVGAFSTAEGRLGESTGAHLHAAGLAA